MTVVAKERLYFPKVPVKQVADAFVIDIPPESLPKIVPALREKEIPSFEIEAPDVQYLKAGAVDRYYPRIPLAIPKKLLEKLGFDPFKEILVSPIGYYGWIPAHKHGARGEYTRVWVPLHIAKAIRIKPNKSVPVLLSGWTLAEREVIEVYPVVRVEHLRQDFDTERIRKRYRWIIPSVMHFIPSEGRPPLEIRAHEIFNHALKQGVTPLAELHYSGRGVLQIDIIILEREKEIAMAIGQAYRTTANQNFTLRELNDYPFLASVRSTWSTVYPRVYYQTRIPVMPRGNAWRDPLEYALNNTVDNMVDWHEFLFNAWKGTLDTYPPGDKRRGERREPPVVPTKNIVQLDLYLRKLSIEPKTESERELHRAGREKAIEGDEIHELIRRGDIREVAVFGYCWKSIRFVSNKGIKQPVTAGSLSRGYTYNNFEIEAHVKVPRGKQEVSRIVNGEKYNGFIWRKW